MRRLIFIVIVLFIGFYEFQSIRTITKNKIVFIGYWLVSLVILINFIYRINNIGDSKGIVQQVLFAFGLVILTLTQKIIALVIPIGEDIF